MALHSNRQRRKGKEVDTLVLSKSCLFVLTAIPDGVELVLTSGGFRVELAAQQFSSCSPSTGTCGCYG